jgi:hypothetical protein
LNLIWKLQTPPMAAPVLQQMSQTVKGRGKISSPSIALLKPCLQPHQWSTTAIHFLCDKERPNGSHQCTSYAIDSCGSSLLNPGLEQFIIKQ